MVRFGSRLCENSDAELARRISISISSLRKPIALVDAAGSKQCVFTQPGSFPDFDTHEREVRFASISGQGESEMPRSRSATSGHATAGLVGPELATDRFGNVAKAPRG